jgi:hypothetical protein
MAGGSVPSGVQTWDGLLTASTVDTVTFADRYNYISVTNPDASGILVVTTDGSTPSASTNAGANNAVSIPPYATMVLANMLPYWNQSRKVIQQGAIQVGNGTYNASTNPSTPSNPGTVTPMEALDGQASNPGTVVKVISSSAIAYGINGNG